MKALGEWIQQVAETSFQSVYNSSDPDASKWTDAEIRQIERSQSLNTVARVLKGTANYSDET